MNTSTTQLLTLRLGTLRKMGRKTLEESEHCSEIMPLRNDRRATPMIPQQHSSLNTRWTKITPIDLLIWKKKFLIVASSLP